MPRISSTDHHAEQKVFRSVLNNGLTVLTEQVPTVRSVTIGVWLREGSRHEPAERQGIAHFIEHLLFKGTENRTAREIAVEIDRFGGSLDAFTSREYACYFAQVLDTHADVAAGLLADITRHPIFPAEEIERERNVIFEEIKMVEDSPDDLAYDLLYTTMWPGHPLGRSIQGTLDTVGAITREDIREFFASNYVPANLVLAVAGNITHEEVMALAREHFAALQDRAVRVEQAPPRPATGTVVRPRKDMEQAHLLLGFPAVSALDERRYALAVLNAMLGGGMSSRLFQAVREERGLAYAIYSAIGGYRDAGNLSIYAGTSRQTLMEALEVVASELRRLKEEPLEPAELENSREHLKGSLTLGLESTSNRMSNLARQEIYYGRQHTLDEVLERIDAVTEEEVGGLAREIFDPAGTCLTLVGNVEGIEVEGSNLAF